ncbi:MAG: hypothetical protein JW881_20620 [Spirochaetales bacterium]|nr:hypothetical protein [Spirochaetales bacterium]
MKKTVISLCIFLVIVNLFANETRSRKETILFLPFLNNGDGKDDRFCRLIPGIMDLFMKNGSSYASVSPGIVREYIRLRGYEHDDFWKNDTLYTIAADFSADFIVRGKFRIETDYSEISIEVVDISANKVVYRSRSRGLGGGEAGASMSEMIVKIVRGFASVLNIPPYEVEYGYFTFITEHPCAVVVDDEEIGLTPFSLCFPAGPHAMKLVYDYGTAGGIVWEEFVDLSPGENRIIEKKVLVNIDITAERECMVFLDGRYIGTGDYTGTITAGRDHALRAVYRDETGNETVVNERIVASERDDISVYINVTASIRISGGDNRLRAEINGETTAILPAALNHILPGNYHVRVLLSDPLDNSEWCFHEEYVELSAGETGKIDVEDIDFDYRWGLCLVPSAAQYYNREPGKGNLVLSGFLSSAAFTAATGMFAAGFYDEYTRRREAGVKEHLADHLRQSANFFKGLYYCGIFMAGVWYTVSCIDGWKTMDRIHGLFYGNGADGRAIPVRK